MSKRIFPTGRMKVITHLRNHGIYDVDLFRVGPHYVMQVGLTQYSLDDLRRVGTHDLDTWLSIAKNLRQAYAHPAHRIVLETLGRTLLKKYETVEQN